MAILDKLAGLGGAVKNTFDRAFGDTSNDADNIDDDADAAPEVPGLDVDGAWVVLGLPPSSTLDDVRAASRALARVQHPASMAKDLDAITALGRIAQASELLEEHLLPMVPGSVAPKGTTPTSTSTRTRATARNPR
ncbi:MAG: J domain-containing protein [Deltaproteobacteria bacterium]|nr:J domain-containing protein [Deltaproteobacteria bacterium]